jgi:hypothetical protein
MVSAALFSRYRPEDSISDCVGNSISKKQINLYPIREPSLETSSFIADYIKLVQCGSCRIFHLYSKIFTTPNQSGTQIAIEKSVPGSSAINIIPTFVYD